MLTVKYIRVLLEKNERFTTPLSIVPWEVPVLIEAHGGGVTELETVVAVRKLRPDAQSEFQRLANRYKCSNDSDVPYVARVFGVGSRGISAIEKLIAESIVSSDQVQDFREVEAPTEAGADVTEVSDLEFVSGAPQEDAVEELRS